MNEHFIKNIEIKNFKCFENFKAEGFSRVNLIGGKNNVGKTAFMEAVYVNVHSKDIKNFTASLFNIKFMRENLNILTSLDKNKNLTNIVKEFIEKSNGLTTNSNINTALFKIEEKNGIKKYNFNCKQQKISVNVNDFSYIRKNLENIQFIDNFGLSNDEIIKNYSAIQKKDEETYLDNLLKLLDPSIEAFKIMYEKPQCKINGDYLEMTEFGDGVRHLVSIVTSLYKCENGYLFIDEIDNGIHYTMIDKLWEVVLKVSKKLNVQVFATTHSKEGIESYARVAKKLEDEDITFIKMTRLDDGSIIAGIREYETIQYAIEDGHEVRGW